MTLFKQSIPSLESKIANLRAEHAAVRSEFMAARVNIASFAELSEDSTDPQLFTVDLATAKQHEHASRSKMRELEDELAVAERALVAAKEKPARQKVSKQVTAIAVELEAAHAQLRTALERMTAAIDAASFRELSNLSRNFEIITHAFAHAHKVAQGAAVAEIVAKYNEHARLIVTGERAHDLGWNTAELVTNAPVIEAAITGEIAALYAERGAEGTTYYSGTRG